VLVIVAMSALLVWRHRKNIAKLLAGKESRIGTKSSAASAEAVKPRKGSHRRIV
jgi:glycerol-3-phosphate acyltransferase PlsY